MEGSSGLKRLRAGRAKLSQEAHRRPHGDVDLGRYVGGLERSVRARSEPRGGLRLARFETHARSPRWAAEDRLHSPSASDMEQRPHRANAHTLLVCSRTLLVRPKKERALARKAGREFYDLGFSFSKFIMGGSDEAKYDHPTQKPVELMRRPILNHLRRAELEWPTTRKLTRMKIKCWTRPSKTCPAG
jgi:hypothetical protein